MKHLVLSLVLLASFSLKAQTTGMDRDCSEAYIVKAAFAENKEDRLREKGANIYSLSLVALLTGNPYIVSGFLLTGGAITLYAGVHDAQEIRANDLQMEGSRRLVRFTKKMKRTISRDITEEEVHSIVEDGMTTGLFCQNYPKLDSPKQIKNHVKAVLQTRYGRR